MNRQDLETKSNMLREIKLVINHHPTFRAILVGVKLDVNVLWDNRIGLEYQAFSLRKIEPEVTVPHQN